MVLVLMLLLLLTHMAILERLWLLGLRQRIILVRLLLVRLAGYCCCCCCCYCCRAEQLDVVQIVQFGHLRVVAVGEDGRHEVVYKASPLL